MRLLVLDLCSGLDGWTAAFTERGHDCVGIEKDARLKPVLEGDVRHFQGQARALLSALVEPDWEPDAVVASPPCEGFSIAAVGKSWTKHPDGRLEPKSDTAREGIEVLDACLRIIAELQPAYFWIENPRAMMRELPQMRAYRHVEITQCSYGRPAAKATDLWGRFPETWTPRPFCRAGARHGVMDDRGHTYHAEGIGTGRERRYVLHAADGRVVPVPSDGRPVLHGRAQALRVLDASGQPCHEWAARGFKTGTQGVEGSAARAKIPYELSRDVCISLERALYKPAPLAVLATSRPTRRLPRPRPVGRWGF